MDASSSVQDKSRKRERSSSEKDNQSPTSEQNDGAQLKKARRNKSKKPSKKASKKPSGPVTAEDRRLRAHKSKLERQKREARRRRAKERKRAEKQGNGESNGKESDNDSSDDDDEEKEDKKKQVESDDEESSSDEEDKKKKVKKDKKEKKEKKEEVATDKKKDKKETPQQSKKSNDGSDDEEGDDADDDDKAEKKETEGEGDDIVSARLKAKKKAEKKEKREAVAALKKAKRQRDIMLFNKLISQFGNSKQLGFAMTAFKDATAKGSGVQPTVYTFTNMINACVRCGEVELARSLLKDMQESDIQPNEVTYTAMIKGLCQNGLIGDARKLLKQMKNEQVTPNLRTYNTILRGALRCGEIDHLLATWDELCASESAPDASSFEYCTKALCQALQPALAWELVKEMGRRELHSGAACSALATCCAVMGDVKGAKKAIMAANEALVKDKQQQKNLVYQRIHEQQGDASFGSHAAPHRKPSSSSTFSSSSSSSSSGKSDTRGSVALFLKLRIQEVESEIARVEKYLQHHYKPDMKMVPSSDTPVSLDKFDPDHVFIVPGVASITTGRTAAVPSLLHSTSTKIPRVPEPPLDPALVQPLKLSKIFGNRKPVRLEICSGHGEWLVERSKNDPESNWLGIEIRYERVYNIWSRMKLEMTPAVPDKDNKKDKKKEKEEKKKAARYNMAVIGGEAHRALEARLGEATLEEVFINYPDPPVWQGSRQRLIDQPLLRQLHRVLKDNCAVVIVTDDETYHHQMLKEFKKCEALFAPAFGDGQVPAEYGPSYFDRLWTNGKKTERYFARYLKKSA